MITKCYLVAYSTDNESLFDGLRDAGFGYFIAPFDKTHFEIYVKVRPVEIKMVENLMRWYV